VRPSGGPACTLKNCAGGALGAAAPQLQVNAAKFLRKEPLAFGIIKLGEERLA
jgi:hypothetical protein